MPWILLAVGGAGYLWWRRRSLELAPSPECSALDAEIQGILDQQDQAIANMGATADPVAIGQWVAVINDLEQQYNERARAQALIQGCDAYQVVEPDGAHF